MAYGESDEAAPANATEAIQLWIDAAAEFGDPIPEPKGRKRMYALTIISGSDFSSIH